MAIINAEIPIFLINRDRFLYILQRLLKFARKFQRPTSENYHGLHT